MYRMTTLVLLFCFGMGAGWVATVDSAEPIQMTVEPKFVNVDAFFSGDQMTVSGHIPFTHDVVLEIIGPRNDNLFDVKGRTGPFWMTHEKVRLAHVPGLYMLLLPAGGDWTRKAAQLGIGVERLRKQISIGEAEESAETIYKMFVELKKSEDLYKEVPGAVTYATPENGLRPFHAAFRLPSSATPGKYTVKATTFDNGSPGDETATDFVVQEIGFIKTMNTLASNKRILYGISAVLIALFSGAIIGLIFKGGAKH